MVAGNTSEFLPKETCEKNYATLRMTNLFFAFQNAFKYPTADAYVKTLFQEAPEAKESVKGKLAIVTGVTVGGSGYNTAEELAVAAEMSVILMGRSEEKLKDAAIQIEEEAKKRDAPAPTLYNVLFDLNSLESAVEAAKQATDIANSHYDGKLHVLVNNAGALTPKYDTSANGVEVNVGRNYLAVRKLTYELLPVLRAAASDTYAPRIVHVASLGQCLGNDFDPVRMLEKPAEGGAPEGVFKNENDGTVAFASGGPLPPISMYSRAKMALVADAVALSKKEPTLATFSLHPGSIASNFGNKMGVAGFLYYRMLGLFQLSPSQGARASLRAALDPTIPEISGAYLHADGNPWHPAVPVAVNPDTGSPYGSMEEYSEKVSEASGELISKLMA